MALFVMLLSACSSGGGSVGGTPTPGRTPTLSFTQGTTVPVTPQPQRSPIFSPIATNVPATWGHQTKTSGCNTNSDKITPDSACTPGAIFPVTAAQVCVPGYSKGVRNVPNSEKDQADKEYGVVYANTVPGQYEVDHFIPLELGGSNDIANLWPEAAQPMPGFHQKDAVENYLHSQVCSGKMTLLAAQIAISSNWLTVYQSMPPNLKEDLGGVCDPASNPDC